MGLSGMKIATKLWSFIVLIIVAICMVAVIGLMRSNSILSDGRQKQALAQDLVQLATEWNGLTSTNSARNTAILISSGTAVADTFKDVVTSTSAEITELQKKIESMAQTDEDKAQLKKVADARKLVLSSREKARDLKKAGQDAEALQVMTGEYEPALKVYLAEQRRFVELQKQEMATLQAEIVAKRATNTTGILVSLAVIVAIIFAGTTWLVRSIREPLTMANELAARIAQGDLTHSVHSERTDEFGQLLHSLEAMNVSLGRMVSEIRGGTDSIAIASAEIATGNNDLFRTRSMEAANLTLADFDAKVAEQIIAIHKIVEAMTDQDLAEEVDMFGVRTRAMHLLNGPFKWATAYKMQLFLYMKSLGYHHLGTMNVWAGIDPKSE